MKKVCLFPTLMLPIPAVKGGAIETLIDNLIEANERAKRIEFTVVSIYDEEAEQKSDKYKYTNFLYIKPKIYHYICTFFYKIFRRLFGLELTLLSALEYSAYLKLKDNDFDYIIAEGGNYYNFISFSKKFGKNKLIAHIHHHCESDKRIDNIFGGVLAISDFVKREWIKSSSINPDKVKVLRNCIDLKKFNKKISHEEYGEVINKCGFSKEDFIILFCGRIIEIKGIKELIQAIINVKNNKIKLLIIGSPNFALRTKSSYLEEVIELINRNSNRIHYTGYIDNAELYKYYQISQVVAMPSIWEEGAGLVAIEAMASGKPMIVTDSGGLVEYTNNECSIQVQRGPKLVENISNAVTELYNSPERRSKMHEEALLRAGRYDITSYYENFMKIIEEGNI